MRDPSAPLAPVPSEDVTQPVESELLLDLKNGRMWRHHRDWQLMVSPDGDRWVYFPHDQIGTYDGKLYKFYSPRDLNLAKSPRPESTATELTIAKWTTSVFFETGDITALYALGIIHTKLAFEPHDLRPKIEASKFKSEGEVEVDGHRCIVLRTVPDPDKRFFEFWVDAADPRMIRQVQNYGLEGDGKLYMTTRIVYKDTEYGPIPESWTIDRHKHSTGKVANYKFQLVEFEANPSVTDADFDIVPPSGTRVADFTRPKDSRNYVEGGPGKPDLPVGEHILQEKAARSRNWMYLGIVAVIGIVAGVFVVYRRRYR